MGGVSWTYPAGSLDALIAGDAVTGPTRAALAMRGVVTDQPAYFADAKFALLAAVVTRLAPWPDLGPAIATAIDARLAAGKGNGWRFADLPADGAAYSGLLAVVGADGFMVRAAAAQDDVLRNVAARLDMARIFDELLAEVAEHAFAQPAALDRIGYGGLADAPGWTAIGLDDHEPREAVEHD